MKANLTANFIVRKAILLRQKSIENVYLVLRRLAKNIRQLENPISHHKS